MSTPNMYLELPVPTQTLGPAWASELNAALELVDEHDHTSGKGKKITQAAMEFTDDIDAQNQRIVNTLALKLNSQSVVDDDAGSEGSVQEVLGDLWWVNGSGVPVQITSAGSVLAAPTSTQVIRYDGVATDTVIGSGASTVAVGVDVSSAPHEVTLPLAAAVSKGRLYIVADSHGASETNLLTVAAAGADTIAGASTYLINSNYGSVFLQSDGVSRWILI